MVLGLPFCGMSIVLFNVDPLYFYVNSRLTLYIEPSSWTIFIIELILVIPRTITLDIFFFTAAARFVAFMLLLDSNRLEIYDHCNIIISKSNLPSLRVHLLFTQLRICHNVLGELYRNFYSAFMLFSQCLDILFWWASIICFGRVPFILWIILPCIGIQTALGEVFYFRLSYNSHALSDSILELERRSGTTMVFYSKRLKKMWTALKPLELKCGHLFIMNRGTILTSIHLILTNFSSLILLTDDRNKVFVKIVEW